MRARVHLGQEAEDNPVRGHGVDDAGHGHHAAHQAGGEGGVVFY